MRLRGPRARKASARDNGSTTSAGGCASRASAWERGPAPADRSTPGRPTGDDPLRHAGPHPLDLPTADQGVALAALDSGRWGVEPGTSALAVHGEGPGPSDALGLVRELRVRDWMTADGQITLAGRDALSRWLDAADRS